MKRILISLFVIVAAAAALYSGGTGAFFSDTESSTGNTFAAGAIDLKVDNESYYNGVLSPNTTWTLTDLTVQKFFDFPDVKPADYGEDTISLHVNTNDAYLCANVTLTSNNENGCTEPEQLVDGSCADPGAGDGDLASKVNFIWWADDGDNVLESGENVISQGPIGALGTGGSVTVPLADSQNNIWTGVGGPVPGDVTQYIGKAWCVGTITPGPLAQDGVGNVRTPALDNNGDTKAGTPEDGGYHCDGTVLGNETQTDSLTADVTFNAVQARNNPGFLCVPEIRPQGKLTVVKTIVNLSNSGNKQISDFSYFIDDGIVTTEVTSGQTTNLPAGAYNVSEAGPDGYQAAFSGDCDAFGNVTIAANDNKTCTITNTELPAHITLKKVVTGTPPLAGNSTFGLEVDGSLVPTGQSIAVTANHPHFINEVGRTGYTFVSITGDPLCPAVLGGSATLSEGQAIVCTITNHKNP